MRQITYMRNLIGDYVISGSKADFLAANNDYGQFLTMDLMPEGTDDDWEYIVQHSDVTMDLIDADDCEFAAHYSEIIKNKYPGWQLRTVSVFIGGVRLWYDKPATGGVGLLAVKEIFDMNLEITAPQSFLGIIPTYQIRVHDGETTVWEDHGYIRRQIDFVKNPNTECPDGYQLEIIEYDGI